MKNYKNSFTYRAAMTQPNFPCPPILQRLIRDGKIGCPHCNSTTIYKGKLFRLIKNTPLGILGRYVSSNVKRYCINDDCLYHYFEIRKDSKRLGTCNEILSFCKEREREIKFERIVK